jgi:hypothetical protein
VAAEVVARTEPLSHPTTVLVEVNPVLGRIRRESGTVEHD